MAWIFISAYCFAISRLHDRVYLGECQSIKPKPKQGQVLHEQEHFWTLESTLATREEEVCACLERFLFCAARRGSAEHPIVQRKRCVCSAAAWIPHCR